MFLSPRKKGLVHGLREELSWRSGLGASLGSVLLMLVLHRCLFEVVRLSFSSISVPMIVSGNSVC